MIRSLPPLCQIDNEILHSLTVKLGAAGFKVQTYPELSKQMDAHMQAMKNWDHKSPLNLPELEDLPMLELRISAYKWVNNTTVVAVNTNLCEEGYLTRDPKAKRSVTSWTADIDTEVVENADLRKHLLKVSTDQINDFIRDWARQNRPELVAPKSP